VGERARAACRITDRRLAPSCHLNGACPASCELIWTASYLLLRTRIPRLWRLPPGQRFPLNPRWLGQYHALLPRPPFRPQRETNRCGAIPRARSPRR
jgi:hypothetical protein